MRTLLRALFLICAVVALPFAAAAQNSTTVTGTITDPNGLPYSFATISAQLQPSSSVTPTIPPPCNGQLSTPCSVAPFTQATADVNGTFSMNLASNAVLTPAGSQWTFTVSETGVPPPAGFGSRQFTFTSTGTLISGATVSISTQLSTASSALTRGAASAGVSSLNTLTGAVILAAGANITLTPVGNTITIASSGGGSTAFPVTVTGGVSGAVPCFTSTTVESAGTLLTANAVVIGGGAGACPTSIAAATTTTFALFATAGAPAFRAIATTDIPTLNQNTTGSAGSITGQLPLSQLNGGTAPGAQSYNFTGVTIFEVRVAAGLTTSANGDIGYDSTNHNWHLFANGVDAYQFGGPVSGTYTNGDCVKFGVASGYISLVDNGSACGSGGGPGTGTANSLAFWSSSTVLGSITGVISGYTLTAVNGSAPAFLAPSLVDSANSPVSSANYPIACDSSTTVIDRAHVLRFVSGASTPTVPLSSATNCPGLVATLIDESAGSLVFGRTGTDTFNVYNGSSSSLAQTSFTLTNGQFATLNQAATSLWEVRITGGGSASLGFPLTVSGATNSGGIPYFSNATTLSTTATLTAHGVLLGEGTGASPVATGAGTSGQCFISNGSSADPSFQSCSSGAQPVINTAIVRTIIPVRSGGATASGEGVTTQAGGGTIGDGSPSATNTVFNAYSTSTAFSSGCATGCNGFSGSPLYAAQVTGTIYQIQLEWPTNISTNTGRYWVALSNSGGVSSLLATDTPAFSMVGLRYSTIAGDTSPVCVTSNGTSHAYATSAITQTSLMKIEFDDNGASGWTFKVNGTAVCSGMTTDIPASGTVMLLVVGETPTTANPIQTNFYGFMEIGQ